MHKFDCFSCYATKIREQRIAKSNQCRTIGKSDQRSHGKWIFISEVSTSEPGTSLTPSVAEMQQSLALMGPVKLAERKKKTNRGRKSMKSMILTTPQKRAEYQEKADRKAEKNAKKATAAPKKDTPSKRSKSRSKKVAKKPKKKKSTSSEEDIDFCMICTELLDHPMTDKNTIECNKCRRPFHLRCVNMKSYFTCRNCDSDLDISDEE